MSKKTYVVTGGAGFIGSHLVDALLAQGSEVAVVDDFSSGRQENLLRHQHNPRLVVHKRSVQEELGNILQGKTVHALYHLAAIPNVQFSLAHPIQTHQVNVNGTLNVLEICRSLGIKRFVFISSGSVYGDSDEKTFSEEQLPRPMSPYSLHKLVGEYYANLYTKVYRMETISLRYFNVFGPRQSVRSDYGFLISKFIRMVNENEPPVINGDGNQTRDFIYISDVINATLRAAAVTNPECFGQAFNIGTGKASSVNEITRHILTLSASTLNPTHGPTIIEPRHSVADISKAKTLLHWEPKISLDEGLQKTYEYFVPTS